MTSGARARAALAGGAAFALAVAAPANAEGAQAAARAAARAPAATRKAPVRPAATATGVARTAADPAAAAQAERDGPADRFPGAGDAYLVAAGGRVVWARHPDAPHAPASLAKIMAALVALERGFDPGRWLPVSARAAREGGTRLGLRAGERIRAGDALAATLVASANDACLVLAEGAGGTAEAFVARMNERAAAIGLSRTRFANPCGHDAPGQATTARDLWTLTRAALAVREIRSTVARTRVEVTTDRGRTLAAATRNSLLGRAPGVRGVKTGRTPAAGRCVVALAERDGREVIVVLLGAADRWWTAAAIVDAALDEAAGDG